MRVQRCIDNLLMRGCDDWVYAGEVASVAIQEGGAKSDDEIRELSLELIREVVLQGLMEIGDLLGEGGRFRKWPMTVEECLHRVQREWNALGRTPTLGDICWLQNTDKGNALGERLLKNKMQ